MKSRYRHLEPLERERERERATGQKERHSRCIKSRYIQREQYKREALESAWAVRERGLFDEEPLQAERAAL